MYIIRPPLLHNFYTDKVHPNLSRTETDMGLAADGSSLPLSYNFDDTHPITLQPLNDPFSANDRVIGARAHHTVRFDYVDGSSIVDMIDPEIQAQYTREAGSF